MCGILGGNQRAWNYQKGIESLHHRGPDGSAIKGLEDFVFAFSRLAIIDLSENGMQPMVSEDGNVAIVYNGEIYDFSRLSKKLSSKYRFRSNSDTEVILYAYIEYGDRFIDYIDGMFAMAIYDKRVKQVKLYRDRAGIKPLYYYYENQQFAFASELKALVETCDTIKWNVDYTALYDYLFCQYIPENKSMYKNCYKLLPAHMLCYDLVKNKVIENKPYWKLKVNTKKSRNRSSEEIEEHLASILSKSVKEQLEADVPVGTYLSGGIDSSIITYESNLHRPGIQAFTIGFQEKKYDESRFASMLIQQNKLNASVKNLTSSDIERIKGNMEQWYDEPFADTSAYPSYIISKMAKEKVCVVLTGDGGDELFGGYQRYAAYDTIMKHKKLDCEWVGKIGTRYEIDKILPKQICQQYINSGFQNYLMWVVIGKSELTEQYRKNWKIDKDYDPYWHLRKYYHSEMPSLTRARYLDFKTYLPGDILTKVDRVSMVNSLEARVPFLSKEVIEFAFSLSEEECCLANNLKKVLKDTYCRHIPKEILYRKKKGFSVPPQYLYKETKQQPITIGILQKEWQKLGRKV